MYKNYLRAGAVNGDPRQITAKFGKCCKCQKPVKGESVYYWPKGKKCYCVDCGESDYLAFLSAAGDECGMPFAC